MKCLDITAFLFRKKLKQRELAESLGVTLGFVGQLATRRTKISYEGILKLIDLGINLEELLGTEYSRKILDNSAINEDKSVLDRITILENDVAAMRGNGNLKVSFQ